MQEITISFNEETNMGRDLPKSFWIIAVITPLLLCAVFTFLWLQDALSALQATTLALALQGIIFGFYIRWDSDRQRIVTNQRWRKQLEQMQEIAQSMSTRFIGSFPKHLGDIAEVVSHAADEVLIIADCVDYGSFSDPVGHRKLLDAIGMARDKSVTIRMLICAEPAAITVSSPHWETTFDEMSGTTEFEQYFDVVYPGKPRPSNDREFKAILLEHHELVRKQLSDRGVKIEPLPQGVADKVGLFFWMEDMTDAVYLFANTGTRARGLAFRTRDAKFLEILKDAFERNWRPKGVG
jgi:hypothetical protein